jgi:hypothetical protein
LEVMTYAGRDPGGGWAKCREYASFPRKYSPLRKLNISPIGAARDSLSRQASSKRARSLKSNAARFPPQNAGDRRKIREEDIVMAGFHCQRYFPPP